MGMGVEEGAERCEKGAESVKTVIKRRRKTRTIGEIGGVGTFLTRSGA